MEDWQNENKKNEISAEDNSVFVAFCISFIIAIFFPFFRNDWSNEILVNIIGYPIQVIMNTFIFTIILSFIFWVFRLVFKKSSNYVVLLIITICFLLVACAGEKLDYGFYQLLRFTVTILSSWNAVKVYKENQKSFWLFVFIAIAILFNPVIKITFEREIWQVIDSVALGAFICYYGYSVTTKKQQ